MSILVYVARENSVLSIRLAIPPVLVEVNA